MPATALTAIRQVMLPVRDLERAVAFYRDSLGASLTASLPPGLAFFDFSGVRLLLEQSDDEIAASGSCLYFAVEDIHEAQRALEVAGVKFSHPAHRIFVDAGGTFGPVGEEEWMAFFSDPDGNTLALAWRGAAQGDSDE